MNLRYFYLIGILFLSIPASSQCGMLFSKLFGRQHNQSNDLEARLIASQEMAADYQKRHNLVELDSATSVARIEQSTITIKDFYTTLTTGVQKGRLFQDLEHVILAQKSDDSKVQEKIEEYKQNFSIDEHQYSCLLKVSVIKGRENLIEFLLNSGAPLYRDNSDGGNSPLHDAVRCAYPAVVKRVLEHHRLKYSEPEAFINLSNKEGKTALHKAAQGHCPATLNALLEYGPRIDIQDAEKRTPLDIAHAKLLPCRLKLDQKRLKCDFTHRKNNQEYIEMLERVRQLQASTGMLENAAMLEAIRNLEAVAKLEQTADIQRYDEIASSIAGLFE